MNAEQRPVLFTLRGMALAVALMTAAWPEPASAQRRDFYFNADRDLASLPAACQARLRGTPEVKQHWEAKLGPEVFLHLHHHCFGMYDLNRAKTGFDLEPQHKQALYLDAIGQFDYVLQRWPKDSPLYAEAARYQQEAKMALQLSKLR